MREAAQILYEGQFVVGNVSYHLADDNQIRQAAFARVRMLAQVYGDDIPWSAIAQPVDFGGEKIAIAGKAVGIFKPRQMQQGALSIRTSMPRTGRINVYSDSTEVDGAFIYSLQGKDPNNRHNQYLKQSCDNQTPLIYFYAVAEGVYKAIFPCFIERIYPEEMTCRVSVASEFGTSTGNPQLRDSEAWRIERRYALRETKVRLHQAAFREQVINAYGSRCAMTGLPVRQLLDAAHIVPDGHELGVAQVNNGICLSRIHHRAFDANLIGISADYRLHVSQCLMEEKDGVILEGGLKALHGTDLNRPIEKMNWPNQELLDLRFEEFKRWS